MHPLAAETGRRVEGGELTPRATREPCLLLELAARAVMRTFPLLECAGRKFEQVLAHGFASLPHERQHALLVDRDDGDRAGMLDYLPLMLAPTLDRDVEQLAVVHGPCGVGLQAAKRSTSRRCSASYRGPEPARAFARACSGFAVAGMTTSTRSSESAHLSRASAHVSTSSASRAS